MENFIPSQNDAEKAQEMIASCLQEYNQLKTAAMEVLKTNEPMFAAAGTFCGSKMDELFDEFKINLWGLSSDWRSLESVQSLLATPDPDRTVNFVALSEAQAELRSRMAKLVEMFGRQLSEAEAKKMFRTEFVSLIGEPLNTTRLIEYKA